MASGDTLFILEPHGSVPPSANAATLDWIADASTPNMHIPVLDFDGATDEHADWFVTIPSSYSETTSQADELAVGIVTVRNAADLNAWAWSESLTVSGEGHVPSNVKQVKASYRVLTATGTYKAAASWVTSPSISVWMCGIATFKKEAALGVRTSAGLPLYYRP